MKSIRRDEYESLRVIEYAGPGTPLHPDRPGYWVLGSEGGGAVLYTGVTISDEEVVTEEEATRRTFAKHGMD